MSCYANNVILAVKAYTNLLSEPRCIPICSGVIKDLCAGHISSTKLTLKKKLTMPYLSKSLPFVTIYVRHYMFRIFMRALFFDNLIIIDYYNYDLHWCPPLWQFRKG